MAENDAGTAWTKLCDRYIKWGKPPKGEPHGWVQWKGTNLCMDFHCKCGEMTHVDGEFANLIQCGKCKRMYWPNAHVSMAELTEENKTLALDTEFFVTTE